jgi:polar amino acid transport system substrate-binding protein
MIKGQKIGAVLGYYYPQLDLMFNNKDLIRVNAETQDALLMMLENKKIEYAVTSMFAAKYFIKKKSKNKLLGLSQIDVSVYPIHFAARKGQTETIKKINAAIAKLKKSKKIDRILKKYQ